MSYKVSIILLVLSCLLILNSYALPEEYLNEFNNKGEVCNLNFGLNYYTYNDSPLSEIYMYSCCDGNMCVELPFDYSLRKFGKNIDIQEQIRTFDAIFELKKGNIGVSQYLFEPSFDLCNFYGSDKLRDESINLGAQITNDYSHIILDPKEVKKVKDIISIGKGLSIIGTFNPSTFVTSFFCSEALKIEENALNAISYCKQYYYILEKNVGYNSVVDDFIYCNNVAQDNTKEAQKNLLVKLHTGVQFISKTISPLIHYAGQTLKGEPLKYIIDETTYEVFERASKGIKQNNEALSSQNYISKAITANNRISQKISDTDRTINLAEKSFNRVKEASKKDLLKKEIINLFAEPKRNYTELKLNIKKAEAILLSAKNFAKISKFNSAINTSNRIYLPLYISQETANAENCKKQNINKFFYLIPALLILIIVLIFLVKRNNYFDEDNKLVIFLFLLLLFSSLSIYLINKELNKDCTKFHYIERKEEVIEIPYVVEEYVNYPKLDINYYLVDDKNQTPLKLKLANFKTINCSDYTCILGISIVNYNKYPLKFNMTFNMTIDYLNFSETIKIENNSIEVNRGKAVDTTFNIPIKEVVTEINIVNSSDRFNIFDNKYLHYENITKHYNFSNLENVTKYNKTYQYAYYSLLT